MHGGCAIRLPRGSAPGRGGHAGERRRSDGAIAAVTPGDPADDPRPGPLPRCAGAEDDVPGRVAAGPRVRAARPRSDRAPESHLGATTRGRTTRRRGSSRCTRAATTSSACCRRAPATSSSSPGGTAAKSTRILQSVRSGLNVLADKPWILRSEDLPSLDAALTTADARRLVAYDIMTERFEITSVLQRELVNDRIGVRRSGGGHAGGARRVHGERAPPDEDGVGRAQHPAGLVLRHGGAGRGPERHRHAPRRSGAVDPLPGPGDRLPA